MSDSQRLLLLDAAAEHLGLKSSWPLRRAIYRGDLSCVRLTDGCNAKIYVRWGDVQAWLEKCATRGKVMSPSATAAINRQCAEAERKGGVK